jgi:predicted dehydrogenase
MERADLVRTATKIGILGCGVISGIYIETSKKIDAIECVAVADVEPVAARYRADQYDIPRACSPHELLADAEVEIVVNLTPNHLHAPIATEIIDAGKHMYSEKPLTVYREESIRLLAAAANANLRVGAAPDTFFGGTWQTARNAIDDGLIGEPFAAMATFQGRPPPAAEMDRGAGSSPTRSTAPGTVSFRQTAAFKYGVAVPFDMGPYYLHALINMFGPARSVVGATRTVFDEAVGFAGVKLKVESRHTRQHFSSSTLVCCVSSSRPARFTGPGFRTSRSTGQRGRCAALTPTTSMARYICANRRVWRWSSSSVSTATTRTAAAWASRIWRSRCATAVRTGRAVRWARTWSISSTPSTNRRSRAAAPTCRPRAPVPNHCRRD